MNNEISVNHQPKPGAISRRDFVRTCAAGASFLAAGALAGCATTSRQPARGAAQLGIALDNDWLFGGKYVEGAEMPLHDDAKFTRVSLPHCVAQLSWQGWKPSDWQDVWIYRRHFKLPKSFRKRRVFVDFDRVMVEATPTLNGHALPGHLGGYLPFHCEITDLANDGDNVLAVKVDSRWKSVPPDGNPKGASSVDYLEPGGIPGRVRLRAVPRIFISDLFARPVNVLWPERSVEIRCTIDAALVTETPMELRVELLDEGKSLASVSKTYKPEKAGETELKLSLNSPGDVTLWEPDAPKLYTVVATLLEGGRPIHDHRTRIGFREARFELDGFFLNGRRLQLFGLNRHEIYPYVGLAMPGRVMRRDAEILRHEFNCNIVRCSHYPQTEAFLDACDELGLMVWEETPGWGYLGDDAWKEIVVQNVHDMIVRDRNHPAIVIWGVRVNESRNDQPLYQRTTEIAKALDGSRPCSGSMTTGSRGNWRQGWHEDVFAFDDYHSAPDGSVGIEAPTPGVPYMLAETVGQFSYGPVKKGFQNKYRRAGGLELQTMQAVYHAQAHSRAAAFPHCSGVIAWCGFDYSSLMNSFNAVKCPGVADVFRIPKLGAAFYQAQISPRIRPVIKLSFYWDFGPNSPRGPGKRAAIFSNCDRLEIFVDGRHLATADPDRENFPHLKHPPFFCDLDVDGELKPELRINGYVANQPVLSRSFSSDPSRDRFELASDDAALNGDGIDATRVRFMVTDRYGEPRAFGGGEVVIDLAGPGSIVGDNPFKLADSGGVGAIWVKSNPGGIGHIKVRATHSSLGDKVIQIAVRQAKTAGSLE